MTTTDLPYPTSDGRTHHEGCHRLRGHHNCAVVEVDRLLVELAAARALAADLAGVCDRANRRLSEISEMIGRGT